MLNVILFDAKAEQGREGPGWYLELQKAISKLEQRTLCIDISAPAVYCTGTIHRLLSADSNERLAFYGYGAAGCLATNLAVQYTPHTGMVVCYAGWLGLEPVKANYLACYIIGRDDGPTVRDHKRHWLERHRAAGLDLLNLTVSGKGGWNPDVNAVIVAVLKAKLGIK